MNRRGWLRRFMLGAPAVMLTPWKLTATKQDMFGDWRIANGDGLTWHREGDNKNHCFLITSMVVDPEVCKGLSDEQLARLLKAEIEGAGQGIIWISRGNNESFDVLLKELKREVRG